MNSSKNKKQYIQDKEDWNFFQILKSASDRANCFEKINKKELMV